MIVHKFYCLGTYIQDQTKNCNSDRQNSNNFWFLQHALLSITPKTSVMKWENTLLTTLNILQKLPHLHSWPVKSKCNCILQWVWWKHCMTSIFKEWWSFLYDWPSTVRDDTDVRQKNIYFKKLYPRGLKFISQSKWFIFKTKKSAQRAVLRSSDWFT